MPFLGRDIYLNINQVDAMRGPQVVAVVELEQDEEGEEEAGNPCYVCIHLVKQIIKSQITILKFGKSDLEKE